jgi:hypothetical protein
MIADRTLAQAAHWFSDKEVLIIADQDRWNQLRGIQIVREFDEAKNPAGAGILRFRFGAPDDKVGIWCADCTGSRRGRRKCGDQLRPPSRSRTKARAADQESGGQKRSPLQPTFPIRRKEAACSAPPRCTKKALGRAAAPTPPARPMSAQSNGVTK